MGRRAVAPATRALWEFSIRRGPERLPTVAVS